MKLTRISLSATCVLLTLSLPALPVWAADAAPSATIKQGDVLPYLEQLINWRRTITETDISAETGREGLLKASLSNDSKVILQKGFTFARAQADVFDAEPKTSATPDQPESRHSKLVQAAADANKNVDDLQEQLKETSLAGAAREQKVGELKLAKARQELLQSMLSTFSNEGDSSGTLMDQINALSRTGDTSDNATPAKDGDGKPATAAPAKEADAPAETSGMFNLSAALITLSHKKDTVDNLAQQTHALNESTRNRINEVRASLKAALAEGNALTSQGSDAKSLAAYHKSVDQLVVRYKRLGAAVIPLGQISMTLDAANDSLQEWHRLVSENWSRIFHQLLLRLFVLSISVAIPLFLSSLARRATQHYVTDTKRQKQLRVLRRVVLGATLTFVVLANFITEFGSLATFAGFITAGLAVALQTVLISLVAHFLFFGRYGVRAGDRVTVSDVTGDVVQIGILRLYIRELKESTSGHGMVPTGKIVAFPNSILFQPTAFYKHMNNK